VNELATDVAWAKVKLANDATYPFLLDARSTSRLEFDFIMDEEMLLEMSGGALPSEHKGNLIIKYIELDPERTEPFHVNCFLPPVLQISEAIRTWWALSADSSPERTTLQVPSPLCGAIA